MRTISSTSLAQLAEDYGGEPVNIIEVLWAGTSRTKYADRDLDGGIQGKILQINPIDEIIQVSNGAASTEVEIILDDTDGSLKQIFDNVDIHKRPCYIYQWFDGIPLDDKFLVFEGVISSPFTWKEADRTVSFRVISKLEDKEIGFSPEEGDFPDISDNLVGQAWPMLFGTVLDAKAVKITESVEGVLGEGFGMHDFTIIHQAACLDVQASFLFALVVLYAIAQGIAASHGDDEGAEDAKQKGEALAQQAAAIRAQSLDLRAALGDQLKAENVPGDIRIIGGKDFEQNKYIKLNISEAILGGTFQENIFHCTYAEHPEFKNFPPAPGATKIYPHLPDSFEASGNGFKLFIPGDRIEGDSAGFFWADGGSRVVIAGNDPQDFVVSITPGTVKRVAAFRGFEGIRRLIEVPPDLYSIRTVDYGSITATVIRLHRSLSLRTDENWEDDLYVTFESDIGPNTVDVIRYLIELYTDDIDIDEDSFDSVRTDIDNYPSHFGIFDRRNLVDALQRIAYEARCALWIKENKFYIKYLPADPDTVTEITEDDIDTDGDGHGTMEIFCTETEDIVTKYTANWFLSYAAEKPNKVILRNNIKKYGVQELEEDWLIYNDETLVTKSMTFWMIRKSNTWKKMRFQTKIHKLMCEALDAVLLNFDTKYIANTDVKAIIEKCEFNSDDRTMVFEVWCPVRTGEMDKFDFAHPKGIDKELIHPTLKDRAAGLGGDGPSFEAHSTKILNITFETRKKTHNRRSQGDRNPSDVGDLKPLPVYPPIDTGLASANPNLITPQYKQVPLPDISTRFSLNLRTTVIYDPFTKQSSVLASFFENISGDPSGKPNVTGTLYMKAKPFVSDQTNKGTMEFKWDADAYAAAAAFLKLK